MTVLLCIECVPTSCESKPRLFFPNKLTTERVWDISVEDEISINLFPMSTGLVGVNMFAFGYFNIRCMMFEYERTGQRSVPFLNWLIVTIFSPFFLF